MGRKIKGKWKVLLTDSCHSGAITPPADAATVECSLRGLDRSLFSLTASRDREQSFESPDWGGGHGIFTYYVVKGLEGSADENRDGIVSADELGEYVTRRFARPRRAGRILLRSAAASIRRCCWRMSRRERSRARLHRRRAAPWFSKRIWMASRYSLMASPQAW